MKAPGEVHTVLIFAHKHTLANDREITWLRPQDCGVQLCATGGVRYVKNQRHQFVPIESSTAQRFPKFEQPRLVRYSTDTGNPWNARKNRTQFKYRANSQVRVGILLLLFVNTKSGCRTKRRRPLAEAAHQLARQTRATPNAQCEHRPRGLSL